ncbi:hypothetical protein Vafri_16743 [Volvox africanus]|uniref:Uncharacterized protein n=1 Tax=Volvox africanus TaxID=51714 RepID=A0A8J4F707_9CHLO|nr:hypothetical protein Vafri_16743 [Volvox africanus]
MRTVITQDVRDNFIQQRAADLSAKRLLSEALPNNDTSQQSAVRGPASTAIGVQASSKAQTTPQTSIRQFADAGLSFDEQAELNWKLGMVFNMNNTPFQIADDPYFLDFLRSLRPALPVML